MAVTSKTPKCQYTFDFASAVVTFGRQWCQRNDLKLGINSFNITFLIAQQTWNNHLHHEQYSWLSNWFFLRRLWQFMNPYLLSSFHASTCPSVPLCVHLSVLNDVTTLNILLFQLSTVHWVGWCTVPWYRLLFKWLCSGNFCAFHRTEIFHDRLWPGRWLMLEMCGNIITTWIRWHVAMHHEMGHYLKCPNSDNVRIFYWSRSAEGFVVLCRTSFLLYVSK